MSVHMRVQGFGIGVLLAAFALTAAGCGDDDDDNGAGSPKDGASGGTTQSDDDDDSDATAGDCEETPLFPFRAMGNARGNGGSDMIRQIREDSDTGELFFTNLDTLFRLAPGAKEPEEIASGEEFGGDFYLTPDQFLFPGGSFLEAALKMASGLAADTELQPILVSMPREGGELTMQLGIPASTTEESYLFTGHVHVVGDNAVYEYRHGPKETGSYDLQYAAVIEMDSWKEPGDPVELYRSASGVGFDSLLVVGTNVYVTLIQGEGADTEWLQVIVNLQTQTVADKTAEELLGGKVIGGDEDWVLVERTDPEAPWGVFRMRPDGSDAEAVLPEDLASDFDQAHGTWVIETLGDLDDDRFYVNTYTGSDGLKQIGCINGEDTTVHVLRAGKDAVFASVYREDRASIFKIPM